MAFSDVYGAKRVADFRAVIPGHDAYHISQTILQESGVEEKDWMRLSPKRFPCLC